MIAYSYYPSAPGGCRAMPVARCCAAISKQRDVLMLSCKQGCPFRGMSSCCHTRWALPMQRDVLMLSYTPGCPFRETSSCCYTRQAAHSERRPHAVIQAGLYPCRETSSCCHTRWAAILISHAWQPGGHDIKNEESAQGRCRHMASPCADSP